MTFEQHGIRHNRSQALVDAAWRFAAAAHDGQTRKYTGEPYIRHPAAVAQLVATVTPDVEAICAAILHDVLEDTDATRSDIIGFGLGPGVANLVEEVTDVSRPEDGNRKHRKMLDRAHLAGASPLGQTIKLADLIHNTESITVHDPSFAKVYLAEKRLLLDVLTKGSVALMGMAKKQLRDATG